MQYIILFMSNDMKIKQRTLSRKFPPINFLFDRNYTDLILNMGGPWVGTGTSDMKIKGRM